MAKTGSERTTAWRKALIEKGYKPMSFLLSPAAQRGLADAAKKHGSASAAIEAAFTKRKDRPNA